VLPGKKYTPEDMLKLVWRRKWAAIVPFLLLSIGTFVVAWNLPNRYRSETVILVVPQKVPESYVRATVTTEIGDRLRSIREQILTRTRLELIIRDLDLYRSERARMPMEDVVERMRRDVVVEIVKGETFRVAYISDDPRKAMGVAERLASEFTNENEQDRSVLASATSDFLQSQLDDARKRLADQEAKVVEFQRRHAGQLPSERDANLQVMHNLQLQVQALIDSMNRDRDRRLFLERILAELEPEAQAARTAAQTAVAAPPEGPAGRVFAGTAAEQLESAREGLKALELRLKPEHPDIVYMKRLVADLEAKAKAEAVEQPSTLAAKPFRPRNQEEANTVRRIQETKQEIAAVDIQLASKQAEEKRLRAQIASFEGRVAATPALEAEFIALTRDYDTLQRGYQSLLAKQEDAKMAAALENRKIGEAFRVLDRARLPESPVSPNRIMINLVGTLVGLCVGLGLVTLLDYRDKGLRSEDDVQAVLQLPILATIPVIEGVRSRKWFFRRRRAL
jgi:polysaccharide chain length determinant protein (PEP-CTERM system associated)